MSEHALAVGNTFPWHELYVADAEKAKTFYSNTLGWSSEEYPMGEMGVYNMFKSGGPSFAGLMATAGNPQMQDIPPHWAIYIAVNDVDETIGKAQANGGSVVVPPMDIPDIGRMALLTDDQGAHFWVYKSSSM